MRNGVSYEEYLLMERNSLLVILLTLHTLGCSYSNDEYSHLRPGCYTTDKNVLGKGTCTGKTLGEILDDIYTSYPDMSQITTIYEEQPFDGSFIYPYLLEGGGFAIAFKRGYGDCPSGCIYNDYYYFETDDECLTIQIGHYFPIWNEQDNCIDEDGEPMWGHPPPTDPSKLCN